MPSLRTTHQGLLGTFSLPENPFMNSRNLTMFGDDATYPGLTVENTIEENPNFVQAGTGMTSIVTWMTNRRNLKDNNYWGWDPDNNKFQVQWPFPEDLSFTNRKHENCRIRRISFG